MFEHNDIHDDMTQPDATRPPQLNQTVCGCRCGRGNGIAQAGEDDSKDGDGESTVAGSADSDVGDEYASFSGDTAINASFERHISAPIPSEYTAELRARVERFLNSTDLSSDVFGDHDADSMRSEPSSDVHSVVTSDARSVRPMSPGPGIGDWAEEVPDEYHFLVRPLRLTPQHRYCRGLVASHLVMRDEGFGAHETGLSVDGHL